MTSRPAAPLVGLVLVAAVLFSQSKYIPGIAGVAVALLLIVAHAATTSRLPAVPAGVLILVAVAAASSLWSDDPARSITATAAYAVVALTGATMATATDRGALLRALDWSLRVVVLACLTLYFSVPSIGQETRWPNTGAFIGYFVHKNVLGTVILVGLATLLFAPRTRWTWRETTAGAMYVTAIILAASSTALAGMVILFVIWLASRRLRLGDAKTQGSLVGITLIVAPVAALGASLILRLALEAVGRDLTFSGRNRIWSGSLEAFREQPHGYGFGTAFGEMDAPVAIIGTFTGWSVPSAHSGYLSMLLQTGWIGALLLVAVTMASIVKAVRNLASDRPEAWWALAVIGLFAGVNIIDTRIDGLMWAVFVLAACWVRPLRPDSPARLANRATLATR